MAKRPVDFAKLGEHAAKHDQFVMKLQYKKAGSSKSSALLPPQSYTPKYRSKFYLRTLEQEQTRKEMEEAKSELK